MSSILNVNESTIDLNKYKTVPVEINTSDLTSVHDLPLLDKVRNGIGAVADVPKILGMTNDVLSVIVVGFSELILGIANDPNSSNELKASISKMVPVAATVLAGIESGALIAPYQIKPNGVQGVLDEMITISTAISKVIVDVSTAESQTSSQAD